MMKREELLKAYAEGQRDFSYIDLSYIDLSNIDLSNINLSNTALIGVNLRWTVLSEATLCRVGFDNADLRHADLSSADLSNASLRNADLRGADLRSTNLQGADLYGVALKDNNVKTYVINPIGTKHQIIAINRQLQIGCIANPATDWAKHYKAIGKKQGYTRKEIKIYGQWIKMINKGMK